MGGWEGGAESEEGAGEEDVRELVVGKEPDGVNAVEEGSHLRCQGRRVTKVLLKYVSSE